ncbi:CHASE2 domain-containing protein [Nostoc favosum]|uniref:CHASE2 domain-containing protein n=1 Tax=Nostoc favosum TaxID=2907819 RepID=UPI0028126358|nr:CHASE2 domain-containing protein [Nostoc favosum]
MKQVVGEIQKHQPLFIGLVQDLDTPDKEISKQQLENILGETPNLYFTCNSSKSINESEALGNPPDTENAFGFSDVSRDDKVVRRSLLMIGDKSANPHCKSPYAFGLVLALNYLKEVKEINHQSLPDGKIKIGNLILPTFPIKSERVGGYQKFDAGTGGLQMLLNYRISKDRPTNSKQLDRIAKRITIENFTNLSRNPKNTKKIEESVKNRIVLIGVTDKEFAKNKLFQTPYQQEITPVWLHAQMISQLLSGVIDRRPFLRPWFGWENVAWIYAWSLVGGFIIWRFRSGINILLVTILKRSPISNRRYR